MITLLENLEHQATILGTGLLLDATMARVDMTGFKALEAPEVKVSKDGTITLRIAVPTEVTTPKKSARQAPASEPVSEETL